MLFVYLEWVYDILDEKDKEKLMIYLFIVVCVFLSFDSINLSSFFKIYLKLVRRVFGVLCFLVVFFSIVNLIEMWCVFIGKIS